MYAKDDVSKGIYMLPSIIPNIINNHDFNPITLPPLLHSPSSIYLTDLINRQNATPFRLYRRHRHALIFWLSNSSEPAHMPWI